MKNAIQLALAVWLAASGAVSASGPDYNKRAQVLDPSIRTRLVGKWTNPVDKLIIEIKMPAMRSPCNQAENSRFL